VTVLLIVNVVLVLVATGYAAFALFRPAALTAAIGPQTPAGRFSTSMYSIRGVPLGVVTAVVVLTSFADPSATRWWLLVAGLVQVGDVILATRHRMTGMAVGAGVAAVVHLMTVAVL